VRESENLSPMLSRGRAYRNECAEMGERALDEAFAEYAESQKDVAADRETVASGLQPQQGHRWTTWDSSAPGQRGPKPYPDWLIIELSGVDTECGDPDPGNRAPDGVHR
jgi:hypothetical protein